MNLTNQNEAKIGDDTVMVMHVECDQAKPFDISIVESPDGTVEVHIIHEAPHDPEKVWHGHDGATVSAVFKP